MPRYPYHNKIKQRIARGELTGWTFVDNYPRIGEALVLFFSTFPPVRPVRPYRYPEYLPLLRGKKINSEEACDVHG